MTSDNTIPGLVTCHSPLVTSNLSLIKEFVLLIALGKGI